MLAKLAPRVIPSVSEGPGWRGGARHVAPATRPPGFVATLGMTCVIAIVLLLGATTASAHELGTTRVRADFKRDHTYEITITSLRKPQLDRAFVFFDGVRTSAMRGDIPPRAHAFSFRYEGTFSTYTLTTRNEGGEPVTQWLDAETTSRPFALSRDVLPPTRLEVIRQYVLLGFTHILPKGLDHILFVLGLFLLATTVRPLLAQVTAFTVAHSITLALTMYGFVSLPSRIVEPAIALSIAYVAVENVVSTKLRASRVAIVFCFGLLHGMGFAGVLRELGLPRREFVPALIAFNAGVEMGQLTVIAIAFLAVALWWRQREWYRGRIVVPASVAIAATGLFWTVQRIAM
jgi:hydrogenase/urease accessory protein HupE